MRQPKKEQHKSQSQYFFQSSLNTKGTAVTETAINAPQVVACLDWLSMCLGVWETKPATTMPIRIGEPITNHSKNLIQINVSFYSILTFNA